MSETQTYDLIIVGAGPAGLTASIYASRYKLKNLVVGKQLGGELVLAHKIENYPGFASISGPQLCQMIGQQVERLGEPILLEDVGRIQKQEKLFTVETVAGQNFQAQTVIVATGSERRHLGVPGEKELMGKGVSYCTTCDAPFYKDKRVSVVGGSDSAVTGAIHAAEFADKVYLVYRGDQLRAEPIWLDDLKKLEASGKVMVVYKTNVTEIVASPQGTVAGVKLDKPFEDKNELPVDGLFIEIGGVPGTSLVKPLGVELTEIGHVKVSETMTTNIDGLYCAGDMVDKSLVMQQAVTAMAQGAIAAGSAYKYMKGNQAPRILGV
jgi:thioredoxin reductase (NADPH)